MITVAALVERLGPALVLAAAGDLDQPLSGVTVVDPEHPTPLDEGVLAVVIAHDAERWADLVARAAAAGAAALAVKGATAPASYDGGSAVLSIEPQADWAQLLWLARVAVSDDGPESTDLGDSLFAIADALAALCGGSVVVHDPSWQLLAYSGGGAPDDARTETLLGRRVPQETFQWLRDAGVVDRMLRGEIVHIEAGLVEGLGERYAAAVLVGGRLYGSIWVIPGAEGSDPAHREGLRRSVEVAALALMRHRSLHGSQAPDHDTAFAELLGGARTERLIASRLDVASDSGFVMAGLRPTVLDPIERAATARRLVGLARGYCEAYRVPALTAPVGDVTYLLFPCADTDARGRAGRILEELHERLHRPAAHRSVLSRTFDDLAGVAGVRATVDELLDLAERQGRSGVTDFDAVQSSWRLACFREVALGHPMLLEGPITLLVDYDRNHNGGYVQTLRTYFDCVGDVNLTAERLHVHANTVRYRLGRVTEMTSLRLDDPHDRLLVELQVRLLTD